MKYTNPSLFYFLSVMVSLQLLSCSFSGKASGKLLQQAQANGPYDIIIVPGIQFENGQWDRVMKGRIYWSKYLLDKGITENIMYSGAAVYSPYNEAEIMALYAEAIGIPREKIYTELLAEHSTENIYYGYKKAKQLGFKKIALASDPFQTRMLKKFVKEKISPDVALIPMVVDTMKLIEPSMTDPVIDYKKAYRENFISIKKRESFWKRLRGTIRGNMDTTAYR